MLGATVKGVGLITAVSAELPHCFALIEDASGKEHHAFLADLKKDQLIFPAEPMPYREVRRRIGYGLWFIWGNYVLYLTELLNLVCHACPKVSLGKGVAVVTGT